MGRLDKLAARRTDPSVLTASEKFEVFKRIAESEPVRYAIGAMQPIDPEYTKNTYREGDRLKNQLVRAIEPHDYEYQGSVTNDTHIKAKSDIDLLVITRKWYRLEPPQKAVDVYAGNCATDLIELYNEAATSLASAYPKANVNSEGATAIRVEGGSLERKIDVVPAGWYHTNKYTETKDPTYKGVVVIDRRSRELLPNTPFLHNARIAIQDSVTRQGMRKAARLMKSLKYDAEPVLDMASYDITSLAYNIPSDHVRLDNSHDLGIVDACFNYTAMLIANPIKRLLIPVPDGSRSVFRIGSDGPGATTEQLHALHKEIADLRLEIIRSNYSRFEKLVNASVHYAA